MKLCETIVETCINRTNTLHAMLLLHDWQLSWVELGALITPFTHRTSFDPIIIVRPSWWKGTQVERRWVFTWGSCTAVVHADAQFGLSYSHALSALVILRLDCCNCVLAGLPATTLAPLQRVLHAAVQLVNGLRPYDHVTSTLKQLHWLPIKQRVDYKLCLLVHKATVRQAPSYLTGMLTAVTEVPPRSTFRDASHGDYVVPRTRLQFGERAFSVAAPSAWNCLPTELKLMRSTPVFKRSLKTFLFQTAYSWIALLNWTV